MKPLNRIIKLDRETSNKIAAGEVVERPLSVVKELVENSIDAGATSITVEIKNGGKSLIKVTDNGIGIVKEDILVAFERHATSKIKSVDDIYSICTLGFRGEALASIASVSNVILSTKTSQDEVGTKITLSAGRVVEEVSIGVNTGTSIAVLDLFFNTPARKKFMKSDSAETTAISDIVNKLALSNSNISFKYIVDNKVMFITKKNSPIINSIFAIYSKEIAKNLIEIKNENSNINIYGYVSNTNLTKATRKHQIFFVNGRYIKSKILSDIVKLSYKTMIDSNSQPVCFLFLNINPSDIDVNIHPAKTEIKFHNVGKLKEEIYKTIRKALLSVDLIPEVDIKIEHAVNSKKNEKQYYSNHSDNKVKNEISEIGEKFTHNVNEKKINEDFIIDKSENTKDRSKQNNVFLKSKKPNNTLNSVGSKISLDDLLIPSVESVNINDTKISSTSELYDDLKYIGSIFKTYLLFEKNEKMYLIDQHAAHEKILYEEFIEAYKNTKVNSQVLLEPIILELSYINITKISNNIEFLKRLGIYAEIFSNTSIIIREVPIAFAKPVAISFIREVLENLNEDINNIYDFKLDSIIQSSCKNAIKANDVILDIEIDALVDKLKKLDDPYTCPHGRPIIISISKNEIMKKFKRI